MPIIFLTALNIEPDFAFRSYFAGAVNYIAKPFDLWVPPVKVSVLVDLYMKNRQLREQAALLRSRLAQTPPSAQTVQSMCQLEHRVGRLRAIVDALQAGG